MKKIFKEDVDILETELLNCYIYGFCKPGFLQAKREFSIEEIVSIKKHMAESMRFKEMIMLNVLCELANLLERIVQLKEKLKTLEMSQINKEREQGYKQILHDYIKLEFHHHTFEHPKLKRRINGIINVQKRYEGNLYQKREIIYRVLRETANQNGCWSTVTEVVNDVYPILEKEFKAFDRTWITYRIEKNNKSIESLKRDLEKNKKRRYSSTDIRFQDRSFSNQIKMLERENIKFTQSLSAYNVADVLNKQLAFNSNDQEQTIINHIRNCPELLAEIIKNPTKLD